MNNSGLARLFATVVVLIGLAVWLKSERSHVPHGCQTCPTDISASRR